MPQSGKNIFQILCNLTYSAGFAFVHTDTGPQSDQLHQSLPSQKKMSLEKMLIPRIFLPKFTVSMMKNSRGDLWYLQIQTWCQPPEVRTPGICVSALFLSTFCLRHHHQVERRCWQ